jgi:hypothetical protein
VKPRNFTRGFKTADGSLLKTAEGKTLMEYFGIHFETVIKLRESDKEGTYQIGILSDDGSIVQILTSNGVLTLDNDGDHTTKMACSPEAVLNMNHHSEFQMKLDYYQGPRTGISLVFVWRKVNSSKAKSLFEPFCGEDLGFNAFNSTKNRHYPTAAWDSLQKRGWKKLHRDNFFLPNNKVNPCESRDDHESE